MPFLVKKIHYYLNIWSKRVLGFINNNLLIINKNNFLKEVYLLISFICFRSAANS